MNIDSTIVTQMFGDMKLMISKMQKEEYTDRFECFESQYLGFFTDLEAAFASDNDIPSSFFEIVKNNYSRFGKLKSSAKVDISMFLIYFVLPLLLRIEGVDRPFKDDKAKAEAEESRERILLSEAMADKWREVSDNPAFDYADYLEIKYSFVKTIFGFQVGK